MEIIKPLLILLSFVQQNLSLAKAYRDLGEPEQALTLLEKIPQATLTNNEKYQVELEKAKAYITQNKPFEALQILQQLLTIKGLTHKDYAELFNQVAFCFVQLQEAKRAILFADMADNQQCDVNREKGGEPCNKVPLPAEEASNLPLLTKIEEKTPFDQAINLQIEALKLTSALPFLDPYREGEPKKPLSVQQKIQQVKQLFVKWVIHREKSLGVGCSQEPFEKVTNSFQQGLNLALLAQDALVNQLLTFNQVIPLQREALAKFKEAKEAFTQLTPPSPTQTRSASQQSRDFDTLKEMLNDEKNLSAKPIPKETNKVIW